jgi:hypothetical protein
MERAVGHTAMRLTNGADANDERFARSYIARKPIVAFVFQRTTLAVADDKLAFVVIARRAKIASRGVDINRGNLNARKKLVSTQCTNARATWAYNRMPYFRRCRLLRNRSYP